MRRGVRHFPIEPVRIFFQAVLADSDVALEIVADEDNVLYIASLDHSLDFSPLYLLRLGAGVAEQKPQDTCDNENVQPGYSEIDRYNLRFVIILVCHTKNYFSEAFSAAFSSLLLILRADALTFEAALGLTLEVSCT